MQKSKAKKKHQTEYEILCVGRDIPFSDDSDDDLPPVEVEVDFRP